MKKPILVTGAHRSGSTWIGKMIAKSLQVGYIHEPFNVKQCPPGICSAGFKYWFTYITKENELEFYDALKKTFEFKFDFSNAFKKVKQPLDLWYVLRSLGNFSLNHLLNSRPLIKDPIALLSAEWLADKFDMDVVVAIRHPAAFVSSIKRLNWTHQFDHFLKQPLLMRDHLSPFESEIKKFADCEQDILDQAILLWKILHHMIAKWQESHPDWIFVKHEDISHDPMDGFQTIFNQLNLELTDRIKNTIKEFIR